MPVNLSHSTIAKALQEGGRAVSRLSRMREKVEEMTGQVVEVVEVSASAFALGVAKGRYGSVEVVGVPLELALGAAGHLLGFTGVAGKYSEHLHNFSNGALACWAHSMGAGVGQKILEKGGVTNLFSGDVNPALAVGSRVPAQSITEMARAAGV